MKRILFCACILSLTLKILGSFSAFINLLVISVPFFKRCYNFNRKTLDSLGHLNFSFIKSVLLSVFLVLALEVLFVYGPFLLNFFFL